MSDVAQMLQQVMDRLDAIEARLDALAPRPEVTALVQVVADNPEVYRSLVTLIAQAPMAMEFMGEFVTTVLTQVDDDGMNMEMRLQECLTLFKRVTKPEVLAQLHMGLDLMEQLPEHYGTGVEILQSLVDHVLSMDPQVTLRIEEAVHILELVTRPEVMGTARKGMALIEAHPAAMDTLIETGSVALAKIEEAQLEPAVVEKYLGLALAAVDRIEASTLDLETLMGDGIDLLEKAATADNLAFAAKGLDLLARMNGTKDVLLSVADKAMARIGTDDFDLETRASAGLELVVELSRPDTLASIKQVTDSGLLEPQVMNMLVAVGEAMATSCQTAPKPAGMFGALGALSDANTKLALGFALVFASQLGGKLGGNALAKA